MTGGFGVKHLLPQMNQPDPSTQAEGGLPVAGFVHSRNLGGFNPPKC